jgi:hypothetical protein
VLASDYVYGVPWKLVIDGGYEARLVARWAPIRDGQSQWRNRLSNYLRVNGPRVAGFVLGKGEREGKGGDERRLAREEITRVRGRTLVFRLATDTRRRRPLQAFYYPEPPISNTYSCGEGGREFPKEREREGSVLRGPDR